MLFVCELCVVCCVFACMLRFVDCWFVVCRSSVSLLIGCVMSVVSCLFVGLCVVCCVLFVCWLCCWLLLFGT